ncbi:MAG: MarP family serine protease [Actinomycetes bacterium]
MNLLDWVLLASLAVAAVGGYRYGFVARAASWVGLALGLVLSLFTAPFALETFPGGSATTRFLIGVAAITLTVGLASSVFQGIGLRMRRAVHATPLRSLDRTAGIAAGILGSLVLIWFLLPAASQVPGPIAAQVRSSEVVGFVRGLAPEPPDPFQALGRLVDDSRFPEVFADLQPAPDTGPPPSEIPVPQEVVAAATASTVNVESTGCGGRYEGSGWAVAEDTIVTNAHVIAGAEDIQVRRPDGEVLPAEAVTFDPDRDLAILRVPGLGQQPLQLGTVVEGGDAAVIGYPGGQDTPRVAPASTREVRTTIGRDIYNERRTERQVVFLAAELRQGDSGSPVISPEGTVVGVTFAVSPDRATTAYALAPAEVEALLAAEPNATTGRCS